MRRQTRIKKFQLLSLQVEKEKLKNEREKLQNDKEALRNSRDFKEITLAITLLAGIGAILFNIIDYFANHAIKESFQGFVAMLVSILLFVFSMIFIFLILKGFLASQALHFLK
jgi:cation transporter-like permease